MTRRNWLLGAFALVVLGAVAATALVTIKPTTPASVSKPKRSAPVTAATVSKDKNSVESVFGLHGDILDNKTVPSIPLATARAQAAEGILIPSSKVLGKATKICLTEAGAPKELVGIGILYDSGVKFFATPSGDKSRKFEDVLSNMNVPITSYDGKNKKQVCDVMEVGGRKYIVEKGGYQIFGDLTNEVKPRVVFVVNGIEYRLIAASGNLKASDLLKVAQEIH